MSGSECSCNTEISALEMNLTIGHEVDGTIEIVLLGVEELIHVRSAGSKQSRCLGLGLHPRWTSEEPAPPPRNAFVRTSTGLVTAGAASWGGG